MDSHDWVAKYYERIVAECMASLERRDRITHWSYTILGVFVGAYASFFAIDIDNNSAIKFALTATILAIMTRFFFQSVIAYGFFTRGRYMRTKIEKYWMDKSDIKELKLLIKSFDYGRRLPTKKNKIASQVRYGPLSLILPLILLIMDFEINNTEHCIVLIMLMAYVFYEILNYVTYDQMKVKS